MNNINTSFIKIYLLLILTSLFFLISINITHSEEKIGSIVSLKEEVFAINADGEKRLLDLYDEILLQDEIVTNELSTATVQYNDNSTIIIKKSSSFKVTDFNITGLKNIFLGEVQKGSAIIESGKIAKDDNGSMVIELPKMTLGIKGTRFNIENKPDGTSAVSLAEDSFGNVGIINISSEGKVKTLFDTEQVVSTNTETGFSERVKTDDEKKELVDASNDLIEASSIDENIIQKNLEEKLLNGSLLDANGDGVIDTLDVEVIKETIKLEKQGKIDFIVDNSTGENTEFLSQVLNKSDEASIGDSINKIFEINNDLVASVMTNLSNEDNTFLTTSNSEANNAIKEKIYTQMLSNSANVETIGKIISKSDGATIEKMINIVSLSDTNDPNSNLSLQVLSSVADANAARATTDPAGLNATFLNTEGQSEVNKLIVSAVANAGNNPESSKMLANVIIKSDAGSIGLMINRIQTVSESNPNSNLSLQVLSSVADANAARATTDPAGLNATFLNTEGQSEVNKLIVSAVANAGNNPESSKMLANVIIKSDAGSIGLMINRIQTVSESNPNSNLSLQVLSSVADANAARATTDPAGLNATFLNTEGQSEVNKLIVSAVANAGNNPESSKMLANVITKSDSNTINILVDSIQTVDNQNSAQGMSNNQNSNLSLQVLSSVADANATRATTDPAGLNATFLNTEGQSEVNKLIVSAVTNAGNNQESSKMLANVIIKSDAATVDKMLNNIETVSSKDSNSTLAAQVLSSVAITAADSTTSVNTELMNKVNSFIDTVTKTAAAETAVKAAAEEAAAVKAVAVEEAAAEAAVEAAAEAAAEVKAVAAEEAAAAEAAVKAAAVKAAAVAQNPTWSAQAAFNSTYTTSDNISTTATATSSPPTNGINYTATGLPLGVTMNATGTISGSPDEAGDYEVTVTAKDKMDSAKSISATYNFSVTTPAATNPTWSAQAAFNSTYTTSDNISTTATATSSPPTNGINYTATGLPLGVTMNATGTISGSPDEAGDYEVTVTAKDKMDSAKSISATYNFSVTTPAATNPTWSAQAAFNSTYTTSDNISTTATATSSPPTNGINYTATGLPLGVTMNATGTISGSPDEAGDYEVTVTAKDKMDSAKSISATYNFSVTTPAATNPTWSAQAAFNSTYTTSDNISTTATATSSPPTNGINYTATGLPLGVTMNATGTISGSPDEAGDYEVTVTAKDKMDSAKSISATYNFSVTTPAATNPTWSVQPTFNNTYTTSDNISTIATATSSPSTNGINYTATGLPLGVTMNATGTISGSPDEAGDYSVTVKAEDKMDSAKSISATYNFSVTTAVTYNAKGFSTTSPFKHQNGTAYDSDGRDYQGYNAAGYNTAGYNSEGWSSGTPPIYNPAYDVSPA